MISNLGAKVKKSYKYIIISLILFALPIFLHPYLVHVLTMFLLFACISTAWIIISGFANQLSFGHSAFFGLGAYVSTLLFLNFHLSPWIGMFVGGFLAVGLSLVVGFSCFKTGVKGFYFILVTMALAEALTLLFTGLREITGGSLGVFIPYLGESPANFQFASKINFYWVILIFWVLTIYLAWRIQNSKFGYYLLAIREDEEAAKALGINVNRYKILAFLISAFITALAGTFYAQYFLYIDPGGVLGLPLSYKIALMATIGGRLSFLGPTLGSAILVPISEFLRIQLGGTYAGLDLLIYGALIIVVIRFMPMGIAFHAKKLLTKK